MPKRYRAIADYYDAENARHKMLEHDVPFFLGQLPNKPQSILELAVGTGRAAIPIAQAGQKVTGVDYADEMLAIARRKRDAVGLGERQLSLQQADILNLRLHKRFDWVCIFFNTFLAFTSLEEQDRLLATVRRHLKPHGRLWLDIFQPDPALLVRDVVRDLDPCAFHAPSLNRTVAMTTEVRRGKRPQVQRIIFHYQWFDSRGLQHDERTEFDMTYIFARELQILIERNGLRIERLFGNYDGSALTPGSPRMIARCCRK
jgi:ubiquinone/menaquinone biosynthesis C-methylase UbiE